LFDLMHSQNCSFHLEMCWLISLVHIICILILCEHLQELGSAVAFSCLELDMVLSKVEKVEKWMKRCMDVLGTSIGDKNSLLRALQKVSTCLINFLLQF
jgi:hypothetical protein